jgi:mannose-6-phosphate isomerase-like protein (cupin superfamily)
VERFPAAVAIAPDADREVVIGEARIRILAGARETGGAVTVLDYLMPARHAGPPAHVHPAFDEIFSVIEGTLTVRLGDELLTAGPGATVVIPGTVAHTFANLTDVPARVTLVLTPGGFEPYFAELAALLADGPPDPDALAALTARYGVEAAGLPIPL